MSIKNIGTVTLVFLLLNLSVEAQGQANYHFDWKKEKFVFASAVGTLATAFIIDKNRETITEVEINALDRFQISKFNRSAIDNNNLNAKKYSDYLRDAAIFLPATILFTKNGKDEWRTIGSMYLQTLATNTALTFISQSVVSRIRPFAYNPSIPLEDKLKSFTKSSFYSGHTSHVSSLCFFTASVLTKLSVDKRYNWTIWVGAATIPALTAYLRYDSGRHFPTDVITGYFIGAAVGYLIPKLHEVNEKNMSMSLIPTPNSLSFSFSFVL